jgi:hypothetical protein
MMKRKILIGSFTILLLMFAPLANAELTNPSFEDDGFIPSFVANGPPTGWDANIPIDFDGTVDIFWASEGVASATLFTKGSKSFDINEVAYIYQDVNLIDSNYLFFDMNVMGDYQGFSYEWEPDKVTAVVLVNDEVVWESPSDISGQMVNQSVDISTIDETAAIGFGIRTNVDDTLYISWFAMWDNIRLTESLDLGPCGGNGYLYTDIDFSCYVDMNDFALLANYWLYDDFPRHVCDIYEDGIINLIDYAELAADYGKCSEKTDSNCIAGDWTPQDINGDGIVNFKDYAEIMGNGGDIDDVINIAEQWLMEFHIEEALPQ